MPTVAIPSLQQTTPRSRQRQLSRRQTPDAGPADRFAQFLTLAILLAGPAIICLHTAFVNDSDIWWHLRTGEWILQHRAVPRTEPFSIVAGSPWLAYSWLFEVIVYKLFHAFGLTGLVMYSVGMVLLITMTLYRFISRLQPDFSVAALLTFIPMYAMGHMFTPRPWLFTVLLFVLELDILMQARQSGRKAGLLWLPFLFALWANTHIQFVDGLFVLGLVFVESILARWWKRAGRGVGPLWMGLALLGSVAGTLANPYSWRLYAVARDLATQTGALNTITELQAIPFREVPDFVILLLALAAAAALSWRGKLISLHGALLTFAVLLSFRSQRDAWATAVVTALILASSIRSGRKSTELPNLGAYLTACILGTFFVFAGFKLLHVNNRSLQPQIEKTFPVEAAHKLGTMHLTGPVYSTFNWGGYLIWNLRKPVVIDSRQNVYGDQRMDRSVDTWDGMPNWHADPELASAAVVIGPVHTPLVQLLRSDPRFKLAYEDDVAAVFLPNR